MGAGSALLWLPGCAHVFSNRSPASLGPVGNAGPFDRTIPDISPRAFTGDSPRRAHEILWDKTAFIQKNLTKFPAQPEQASVVVIGGGISGLTSAYLLKDLDPIVLELGPRFGGNSRGEQWRGIEYSIGAAYFSVPDPEGPLHKLLIQDLELHKICEKKTLEDPVLLNGKLTRGLWDGVTAENAEEQFVKVKEYLRDLSGANPATLYPEIPSSSPISRGRVNQYDEETLQQHLERIAGEKLHPHVQLAVEHYCWSAFGGSASEISAAAGLNFLIAEFESIYVPRGGNAAVSEQLYRRLMHELPAGHMRNNALVFDVRTTDSGVLLAYEDAQKNIRSIHAKAVIMACPKFVAEKIIHNLEPEKQSAFRATKYRGYVVGNAVLSGKSSTPFYDCFLMGNGKPEANITQAGVTDIISSGFTQPNAGKLVLTLYRAFPYEGARTKLYADTAYESIRKEMERLVTKTILPGLQEPELKLEDIRLARWGHALPLATRGRYADGSVDELRRPIQDKIFFVEQDNWLLPCLETAMSEAITWTEEIRRLEAFS